MKRGTALLAFLLIFLPALRASGQDLNAELARAIEAKDVEQAKQVIARGADVNKLQKTPGGIHLCPLRFAVEKGVPELVRLLLDSGAQVDEFKRPNSGYTPLCFAAERASAEIVELLLKKGADVNFMDRFTGFTPLIRACIGGKVENIKLLLAGGARTDLADTEGETALHWLLMQGGGKAEAVRMLLAKGANVNAVDGTGYTPLMCATKAPKETVELLIAMGAEVNARNKAGGTALMIAARAGLLDFARQLVAKGADVNAKSNNGTTALSSAESPEMIAFLRQAGAQGDKQPIQVPERLSAENVKFLKEECQVDPADIEVMPKLEKQYRDLLYLRTVRRECKLLEGFKNARAYFRKLQARKKGENFPMPPPGWTNNFQALTDEEFAIFEKCLDDR